MSLIGIPKGAVPALEAHIEATRGRGVHSPKVLAKSAAAIGLQILFEVLGPHPRPEIVPIRRQVAVRIDGVARVYLP